MSGEGQGNVHVYCSHLALGFRLRALGTDLRLCFAILSMTADCRKKRHVDCSMASLEGEQLLRMDSISCAQVHRGGAGSEGLTSVTWCLLQPGV